MSVGVGFGFGFVGGLQQSYGSHFGSHFGNISQLGQTDALAQMGSSQLYGMANQFASIARMAPAWSVQQTAGFAAVPDFSRAGALGVDKETNTVKTPGGFEISVNDGMVKIKKPNGKWTTIKAEPPGRTLTDTTTGKQTRTTSQLERVLRRDPAVRESDGDVWRYQGLGTFKLPDGTKIRINEVGEGKTLHIDQVDIYNGNKHVSVKSQLLSSNYKTAKTETSKKFGPWRNIRTTRSTQWRGRTGRVMRNTTQQRSVTTTTKRHQVVDQKFKTTISDVQNNGFMHDAMNNDGLTFNLAGKTGEAWSHQGREVLSGAGKGKDDKTKAYQLGEGINGSSVGQRGAIVPWNLAYFNSIQATQSNLMQSLNGFMGGNSSQFLGLNPTAPHLGGMTQLSNWGVNSTFAGPFGGAGMFGGFYNMALNPAQMGQQMFGAVNGMHNVFNNFNTMGAGLNASVFAASLRW